MKHTAVFLLACLACSVGICHAIDDNQPYSLETLYDTRKVNTMLQCLFGSKKFSRAISSYTPEPDEPENIKIFKETLKELSRDYEKSTIVKCKKEIIDLYFAEIEESWQERKSKNIALDSLDDFLLYMIDHTIDNPLFTIKYKTVQEGIENKFYQEEEKTVVQLRIAHNWVPNDKLKTGISIEELTKLFTTGKIIGREICTGRYIPEEFDEKIKIPETEIIKTTYRNVFTQLPDILAIKPERTHYWLPIYMHNHDYSLRFKINSKRFTYEFLGATLCKGDLHEDRHHAAIARDEGAFFVCGTKIQKIGDDEDLVNQFLSGDSTESYGIGRDYQSDILFFERIPPDTSEFLPTQDILKKKNGMKEIHILTNPLYEDKESIDVYVHPDEIDTWEYYDDFDKDLNFHYPDGY